MPTLRILVEGNRALWPIERHQWGHASRLKAEREFDERTILELYADTLRELL